MAITDLIWLRVCAHVCACMRECVVRVHDTRGVCVWRAWGGRRLGLR